MHELTKVDKIVVTELVNNARVRIKDISRKYGISKNQILQRTKILEEEGIFGGYTVDFNTQKIGLIPVDLLIKTKKIPDIDLIRESTKNKPFIHRFVLCTGPYNVQVRCYLKELEDLEKAKEFLSNILDIQDFERTIIIEKTFYLRDFFDLGVVKDKIYGTFHRGLKPSKKCSNMDLKILSLLAKNSRMSMSEIAKIIEKPISTVNFRFKKLKNEKIIEKFTTFIRGSKFGQNIDMIKLDLSKNNEQVNRKIIGACYSLKKIFVIHRLFGKWEYSLLLLVKNLHDTYSVAKKLQDMIPEIDKVDIFRIYEGFSKTFTLEKIVK